MSWSASILQTVLYNECWNRFFTLPTHMITSWMSRLKSFEFASCKSLTAAMLSKAHQSTHKQSVWTLALRPCPMLVALHGHHIIRTFIYRSHSNFARSLLC